MTTAVSDSDSLMLMKALSDNSDNIIHEVAVAACVCTSFPQSYGDPCWNHTLAVKYSVVFPLDIFH